MDKKINQISVRFPVELRDKLEHMAEERYTSFNSAVIWVIADWFKTQDQIQRKEPTRIEAVRSEVRVDPSLHKDEEIRDLKKKRGNSRP